MNPRIASYVDILSVLGFGWAGGRLGLGASPHNGHRTMGQCHCGRVLFSIPTSMMESIDQAPRACRDRGELGASACLRVPRQVFDVVGARPKAYRSRDKIRLFCGRCGTTVAVIDGGREPSLRICAGTLDPEPSRWRAWRCLCLAAF